LSFADEKFIDKIYNRIVACGTRDETINVKQLYKFYDIYNLLPTEKILRLYPELVSLNKQLIDSIYDYSIIELIFNFELTTEDVKIRLLDIIIKLDIELYFNLITKYKINHNNTIDRELIFTQLKLNPLLIEFLLENEKFNKLLIDNKFWLLTNSAGNYCLSSCNDNIITKYIDHYDLDDLRTLNNYNIPRIFAFYESSSIIDVLIEKFTLNVLAMINDKYNRNIYYYLILNKNSKYEIEYNKLNPEYIIDIIIQTAHTNPELFKTQIEKINEKVIGVTNGVNGVTNKNYETLWMQLIKSNLVKTELIEWALENKMIKEIDLYCDINHGSILTTTIKSRPELFDKIIEIDKNFIIKDTIDLMIDPCADSYRRYNVKLNILYLAGICNVEIFRKILKLISPFKLNQLINTQLYLDSNEFNLAGILALNNPESFQVLISSDYCTTEMVTKTEQLLGSLAELYEFQPASIYYMQSSPKFNEKIQYDVDEHFYGFNYKVKLNKERIKNISHYILGKQEVEITNPCTICGIFKNKVLFTTCKHKYCITCSLKSNSCPLCRKEVTDTQKILI
jgi:hypothetical protein